MKKVFVKTEPPKWPPDDREFVDIDVVPWRQWSDDMSWETINRLGGHTMCVPKRTRYLGKLIRQKPYLLAQHRGTYVDPYNSSPSIAVLARPASRTCSPSIPASPKLLVPTIKLVKDMPKPKLCQKIVMPVPYWRQRIAQDPLDPFRP